MSLLPDRRELFHARGPARAHAPAAICAFVTLVLLFCSTARAAEIVTPESHAKRYFKADLVIFGEVLSCTSEAVQREDVPGDSGWVSHRTTSMNACCVRVDSVLKASFKDSTVVVRRESSKQWKSRFDRITEDGDSLYLGEMMVPSDPFALTIPSSGRWIFFLKETDSAYTFMWYSDYCSINLDLYAKFEELGQAILENYDLSGWWKVEEDSVWHYRLMPKPIAK